MVIYTDPGTEFSVVCRPELNTKSCTKLSMYTYYM
jgi:hypothetical protein